VYTSAEDVLVQCEVPGVESDDLDVNITGETLTIKGVNRPAEGEESMKFIQRERGHGEFTRTVVLPDAVEADKIEASLRDGILTVRLPKAAGAEPRQIEIKA
jgi:HSP20 family protein